MFLIPKRKKEKTPIYLHPPQKKTQTHTHKNARNKLPLLTALPKDRVTPLKPQIAPGSLSPRRVMTPRCVLMSRREEVHELR